MEQGSVGIVEPKYFTFDDEFRLESGEVLSPVTIAYETYGTLSEARDNVILIEHALSGDAHAAGYHPGDDKPGWWDSMIGSDRGFDTDKYFVICSNVIGGCKGTTGPMSINPKTGKPYGLNFPIVTVGDMVNAQKRLLDHLGIKRLLSVSGGSMGGMQVLQWPVTYPEMVVSTIPIATTSKLSAQAIAFNAVGRHAIMADPNWNNGNYYDSDNYPNTGLSIARMVGHITYLSDESMRNKFGRKLQDKVKYGYEFSTDFEVESYLKYKGDSFTQRFDANSYLYMTKAMDYFDLSNGSSLAQVFRNVKSRFLIISFSSDWLFPTYQAKEVVSALKANAIDVTFTEIKSSYGHDAFLLESDLQTQLINNFLAYTMKGNGNGI